MKFLENDRLCQLTAQLTEANIAERVINGRIEIFSMKRAGTDKKYAHALGEKYQHEIKAEETEFSNFQRMQRSRSGSIEGKNNSYGNSGSSERSIGARSTTSPSMMSIHSIPETGTDNKSSPNVRKLMSLGSPPSPRQKRVRIDPTPRGRPRSNSTGTMPTFKPPTMPIVSAIRSRSDSFDVVKSQTTNFPYSNSPLGDFHDTSTQRLMTDLILTLNTSFPDYDFSNIRPSHFSRVPSSSAVHRTNERLSELAACTPQCVNFLPQLWNSVDDAIDLNESEVYSYVPPTRDDDDDPMSFLADSLDGTDSAMPLWTFNFFFVNKSLKRILLFTCVQTVRTEVGVDNLSEDGYVIGVGDSYVDAEVEIDADEVKDADAADFGSPDGKMQRILARLGSSNYIEEEDEGGLDYDMDADGMNQAVSPPATVA